MNTIRKYRDVLKLILKDAFKKDIIPNNPIDKMAFKFTIQDKKKNKFVTYESLIKMINSFEKVYYKHFIWLGYYTGMKKGELLGLKWKHINLKNRIIHVQEQLNHYNKITTLKTENSN